MEKGLQKNLINNMKGNKKVIIGIIAFIIVFLGIYLGMVGYFNSRFYFGSEISAVSVSGKTVEDAKTLVTSKLDAYALNLKQREGKSEQIKASDAGLRYNLDEEIKGFKDKQNPFKWVLGCFSTKDSKMTLRVSYDEKLLKEKIDSLSCFESNNIIEPKNPNFKYQDGGYVIQDEVIGNKVDKEVLYNKVVESILKGASELDLDAASCYINPKYTSKSEKTLEIKNTLNKYVSSKITYTFGEDKEFLDGSTINNWLIVDDNFEAGFDNGKVREYIDTLSQKYNTVGKTRSFHTSSGNTVNVSGGDYGWAIDKVEETQNLIEEIKKGQTITKEPAYSRTARLHGKNDIGNTYVEIDMTKQHMWFYKNGVLITHGDVVTGNVAKKYTTPKGVYKLKYKQKDAILRGEDYETPVTYWMPFNRGIGIHDANWRKQFGGEIYKTKGSHGCVNSPHNVAKEIFNNIQAGTPVVCY